MSEADGFLSRWSRRKTQHARGESPAAQSELAPGLPTAPATVQPNAELPQSPVAAAQQETPSERPPAPTLADTLELTPESDFRRFVKPDVDPAVRNAAVKKLFADPHFNVMDGLDTYIDDYHTAEGLPAAALRQMVQARALGMLDDELTPQPELDHPLHTSPAALAANDPASRGLPGASEPEPPRADARPVAVAIETLPHRDGPSPDV